MAGRKVLILVLAAFTALLLIAFSVTDGYGGADSYQHYLISRYSWKHPLLFLDHWGKPVFTLLSSVFSQAGYKGLLAFNCVVTVLSALLVYKVASKNERENPLFGSLFFLLMPMVILTAVSALTEPLFGFVLILSVWLFSEKNYFSAIILLSFLPLVRSEGFVVFPVFALALIFEGKWKYIPLFAVGALIYSLAGYFAIGDFLWLINRSPYSMGTGIYGSGTWYHFIVNSQFIFGIPVGILLLTGLWFYIPRNIKWIREEGNVLRFLIAGCFAVFFVSHSYVWWKGTGGSLGLVRVIAGVCPLAALISLSGYNSLVKYLRRFSFSQAWVYILFFITGGGVCYNVVYDNLKQHEEQETMQRTAEWIKSNPALAQSKFYYYNPHIAFLLDRDIFNRDEVEQLWGLADEKDPLIWLKDGQFLVWDAHFGSNEGHTTLDKLLHQQHVKILKRFYPQDQTPVLGGYNYEVFVFGKQSGWKDTLIHSGSAFSAPGDKIFTVDKEFTDVIEEDLKAFSKTSVVYLDLSISYPAGKKPAKDDLLFVLEMKCGEHTLKYETADLSAAWDQDGEQVLSWRLMLPPLTDECSKIKAYFWNRNKVVLDQVKVKADVISVP